MAVGRDFDLTLAGGRAMGSMRLEKGYGSWGSDLSPDFTPLECGMERFIRTDKGEFNGREAYLKIAEMPVEKRFRQFVVNTEGRDCFGGEAIFQNGRFVGYVTSAGFGHATGKSIALGYVSTSSVEESEFEIDLLGERVKASLTSAPLYDPAGERMRA